MFIIKKKIVFKFEKKLNKNAHLMIIGAYNLQKNNIKMYAELYNMLQQTLKYFECDNLTGIILLIIIIGLTHVFYL